MVFGLCHSVHGVRDKFLSVICEPELIFWISLTPCLCFGLVVFLKISEYKDQKRIRYIAIALVSSFYTVIEYILTILY